MGAPISTRRRSSCTELGWCGDVTVAAGPNGELLEHAVSELDLLVADQARDMAHGDRVWSLSVDRMGLIENLPRRRQVVTDPRHGRLSCYTHLRCRCSKCRAVHARYERDRRKRKRAA